MGEGVLAAEVGDTVLEFFRRLPLGQGRRAALFFEVKRLKIGLRKVDLGLKSEKVFVVGLSVFEVDKLLRDFLVDRQEIFPRQVLGAEGPQSLLLLMLPRGLLLLLLLVLLVSRRSDPVHVVGVFEEVISQFFQNYHILGNADRSFRGVGDQGRFLVLLDNVFRQILVDYFILEVLLLGLLAKGVHDTLIPIYLVMTLLVISVNPASLIDRVLLQILKIIFALVILRTRVQNPL